MHNFSNLEMKNLFPTPLVVHRLPDADRLNPQLRDLVHANAKTGVGVAKTNRGGWQSEADFLGWAGDAGGRLINEAKALADHLTFSFDGEETQIAKRNWQVNAWANINRAGDYNVLHTHPGAYWSGCYYVDVGDVTGEESGGQFEIADPRGPLALMYAPTLRMRIKGAVTAGAAEFHTPQAGQMILFPSWLSHAVTPYKGKRDRISIAFNLGV